MIDSEQLHAVRARGLAGGGKSLAYFEWSAPDGADPDDRDGWAQSNPALGIRISEEFIEREQAAMPKEEFARERLGIADQLGVEAVIDLAVWDQLADPGSVAADPIAFAVDVSPDRSSASISAAGLREDGCTHVEVIPWSSSQHGPAPAGLGWVVPRLVALNARWNPCAVALDPGSAAGSLLAELTEAGVDPHLFSGRDVGQACGAFYDEVIDGTIRHLGQDPLRQALAGAKKRPLGDAWAWNRKTSTTDITPLVSATLALWVFKLKQSEVVDVSASVW